MESGSGQTNNYPLRRYVDGRVCFPDYAIYRKTAWGLTPWHWRRKTGRGPYWYLLICPEMLTFQENRRLAKDVESLH